MQGSKCVQLVAPADADRDGEDAGWREMRKVGRAGRRREGSQARRAAGAASGRGFGGCRLAGPRDRHDLRTAAERARAISATDLDFELELIVTAGVQTGGGRRSRRLEGRRPAGPAGGRAVEAHAPPVLGRGDAAGERGGIGAGHMQRL